MSEQECGCWTCDSERRNKQAEESGCWYLGLTGFMIVCPDCGNKRCPKATHHDNACTGSNEPGQDGSRYRPINLTADPRTPQERAAALLGEIEEPTR